MAGANRVSGLRGLRGSRLSGYERAILGDRFAALGYGSIDWSQILTAGITTAGNVAQVALKPPTYSSIQYPSGYTSVQSYGALPAGTVGVPSSLTSTSLLDSPYLLLGGLALLAVVLMKR